MQDYDKIVRLLTKFTEDDCFYDTINEDTFLTSVEFIDVLIDNNMRIGPIRPDGDGGLLIRWKDEKILLIIDDNKFHYIVNPTTMDAIYYENISKEIMYETVNKRINGFENFNERIL